MMTDFEMRDLHEEALAENFLRDHEDLRPERNPYWADTEVLHDRTSSRIVRSYDDVEETRSWRPAGGRKSPAHFEGLDDESGLDAILSQGGARMLYEVPDVGVPARPELVRLRKAFMALERSDRDLLWARYVMNLTLEAMSGEGSGKSKQSVQYRLRKAERKLKLAWETVKAQEKWRPALDELGGEGAKG